MKRQRNMLIKKENSLKNVRVKKMISSFLRPVLETARKKFKSAMLNLMMPTMKLNSLNKKRLL